MKSNNLIPRVLLACPTSARHAHLLDRWITHLDNLTYPNFEVLLVDTTEDKGEYCKILEKKQVHGKQVQVIKFPWDPKYNHILQHLAYARDSIRKYVLDNNFDYLFSLDDDIFIPKNSIQKLLSRSKDMVGFYVHIYNKSKRKPCIFKEGGFEMNRGLFIFSFAEINAYKKFVRKYKKNQLSKEEKLLIPFMIKDKWRPDLIQVYAVGIGCLMIKRNVLEAVPFRTHPTFIWGEDNWFFTECNDKKFEFYCDTSVRAEHKNTNWIMITEKCKQHTQLHFVEGPVNAKKAVVINPKGKKRK